MKDKSKNKRKKNNSDTENEDSKGEKDLNKNINDKQTTYYTKWKNYKKQNYLELPTDFWKQGYNDKIKILKNNISYVSQEELDIKKKKYFIDEIGIKHNGIELIPYYDVKTLTRVIAGYNTTYPPKSHYWFHSNMNFSYVANNNYLMTAINSSNFTYLGIYAYREKKNKNEKIKKKQVDKDYENEDDYNYHTFLYLYFKESKRISLNHLQTLNQVKLDDDLEYQIRLGRLPGLPGYNFYKFYQLFSDNDVENKQRQKLRDYYYDYINTDWNKCDFDRELVFIADNSDGLNKMVEEKIEKKENFIKINKKDENKKINKESKNEEINSNEEDVEENENEEKKEEKKDSKNSTNSKRKGSDNSDLMD